MGKGRELQKSLAELLNKVPLGIKWEPGWHIFGKEEVDLLGEDSESVYLVEIETKREDPVNNTVKIWRHVEEDKLSGRSQGKRVVVVQAFSNKIAEAKRRNSEFIGRKMRNKGIDYSTINFNIQDSVEEEAKALARKLIEKMEAAEETQEILADKKLMAQLAEADRDWKRGNYVEWEKLKGGGTGSSSTSGPRSTTEGRMLKSRSA